MSEPERATVKKWYVVHTYSGQENRAKQSLLERAAALGHEDAIDEVLIPEENVVEMGRDAAARRRHADRQDRHRRDLARHSGRKRLLRHANQSGGTG